jgi:hypothetical protein
MLRTGTSMPRKWSETRFSRPLICHRRNRSSLILVLLGALISTPAHSSENYPNRPVRWIVPFAPAGPTDLMSRPVAEKISQRLGQPFVVDNRAGAGGNIGAEVVAKSAPDGHMILLSTGGPLVCSEVLMHFTAPHRCARTEGKLRFPSVTCLPSARYRSLPRLGSGRMPSFGRTPESILI